MPRNPRSSHKTRITQTIKDNLHPLALQPSELNEPFGWHDYAEAENSSQALCLNAFGSLRHKGLAQVRDRVVVELVCKAFPAMRTANRPRRWTIEPEAERPELLNEYGGQPTSVDALLTTSEDVVAVESKFDSDARAGFGPCSCVRGRTTATGCKATA